MTKRYQLLVFDWDGTLMDSEHRIVSCAVNAIAEMDEPPIERDQIKNIIGLGLAEACEMLFPGRGTAFHGKFIDRYRSYYLGGDKTPSPLFPDVRRVLLDLGSQGYLMGVATGKGRPGLERVLEETELAQFFDVTRCTDDAFSKPHPEMLNQVMESVGIEPNETLMIGDTEYDMEMARNAGADALAVSYGVHSVDRLMRHSPVGCIDSFSELPGWLPSRNPAAGSGACQVGRSNK